MGMASTERILGVELLAEAFPGAGLTSAVSKFGGEAGSTAATAVDFAARAESTTALSPVLNGPAWRCLFTEGLEWMR